MISWLMTMMDDREPRRVCQACHKSYPAALEECPWCYAGNEEF